MREQASITPEQALALFDELFTKWSRENPKAVETQLQGMDAVDLRVIAQELGVTFPTKPSKSALYLGIIGRLNERAMLSKNVNVTPSQRKTMEDEGKGS